MYALAAAAENLGQQIQMFCLMILDERLSIIDHEKKTYMRQCCSRLEYMKVNFIINVPFPW